MSLLNVSIVVAASSLTDTPQNDANADIVVESLSNNLSISKTCTLSSTEPSAAIVGYPKG